MIVCRQTLYPPTAGSSLQGYLIRLDNATMDEYSQKISIRGGKTCTQPQDEENTYE